MRSLLSVALLLTLFTHSLRADSAADAKKAISSSYAAQSAAFGKGDFKAFAASHMPDYSETDMKGRKQDLKALEMALKGISSFAKNLKRTVKVKKVTVKGPTAAVEATEALDAVIPNPQTGKNSTMHAERDLADTWTLQNKRWLRKSTKTLSEKQLVDGKPFSGAR
jgi:hypothetical protein